MIGVFKSHFLPLVTGGGIIDWNVDKQEKLHQGSSDTVRSLEGFRVEKT